MAEFTKQGQGTLNTILGAVGTYGAIGGGGNVLGGLFGGGNQYVSRETFDLSMKLNESERSNAILSADLASEKKMVEVFNAANNKIMAVRDELGDKINSLSNTVNNNAAAQAVINCGLNNSVGILQTQMASVLDMTKLGIDSDNIWTTTTSTT